MTRTIADLSPEQRFIVDTVRLAFSRTEPDGTGAASQPRLNWDSLLAQVSKQALAPLVYSGLKRSRLTVPAEVQSRIRMGFLAAVLHIESSVDPVLRLILQRLEDAHVRPIVLKGAALAHTVYPDPAFRTMGDIDLLVAEDEIDRARQALDGLDSVAVGGGVATDHHHLSPHYVKDRSMWVEIHHHLLPEPNPYALNLRDIRDRSLTADLAGVEARVLALTDSLH
ncbi:MAG: nucleotidyltransferase family protein, partial [Actinobacteria bacterium]|nr:nucleotidyltransferase family protein [Actinomycetota bacterium]